jgi:hypothetical protein
MNNVNGRLKALKAKFHPGTLVITPTLCRKVDPDYAMSALVQHLQAKWGVVDAEDAKANDDALANGGRLLSAYPLPNEAGVFWIITEGADENGQRSVTTLLLPSDY